MKTIIGYTDSINECDCCGKVDLKGTFCIELDGEELYYGSVCAFKDQGLSIDDQKQLKAKFTKAQKNAALIEKHIAPLGVWMDEELAKCDQNDNGKFSMKTRIISEYNRVSELRAKKYKITI